MEPAPGGAQRGFSVLSEVIDVNFDTAERTSYLDEVREHLPAFLSEVAYGRSEPIQDVSGLLNLGTQDLNRVIATHLALSQPIARFIDALPEALRRPTTASLRPAVLSRSIRGPVDWNSTFQARNQQGGNPGLFVVRPAERIFDTPENQAFVWFLSELSARMGAVRPVEKDRTGVMVGSSWYAQIIEQRRHLSEARRHRWLSTVEPQRPSPLTLSRMRSARSAFYAEILPGAIEAFLRYTERPGPEEITELLCEHYFEPRLNWQLFELVVSLRLARAFENALGTKRSPRKLLVGHAKAPFARYTAADGGVIQLWYQSWPDIETRSLLREARDRHGLGAGSSRPDIVMERRSSENLVDSVLLEIKASRNPRTLGAGLLQMLGYLKERPDFWPEPTPAWLVAPESTAFESGDADGQPLWIISAEEVAEAAVKRMIPT